MKTLGVPVVAIGVPTVVDVISIFNDTLEYVSKVNEEEMIEAAKRNNKLLMIGFVMRFGDETKITQDFIEFLKLFIWY